MYKKILAGTLALAATFGGAALPMAENGILVKNIFLSADASYAFYKIGDWEWLVENGVVSLYSYLGSAEEVTLPTNVPNDNQLPASERGKKLTVAKGFLDYKKWVKVTIPEGYTEIAENAFYNSRVISVNIPSTIRKIGDCAFSYSCVGGNFSISKNVEEIGQEVFLNMPGLESFSVDSQNKNFTSKNGVLYNKSMTELLSYPMDKCIRNFEIPSTVKKIVNKAFLSNPWIQNVTIPDSVVEIGICAFDGTGIKNIEIPKSVTNLDEGALLGSQSMSEAKILANIDKLSKYTFSSCTNLKTVTLPKTIKSIEEGAFYECFNLETIKFEGTEDEWKQIKIDDQYNGELSHVKIIFNSHIHNYTTKVIAPTYFSEGYTLKKCSCGDTLKVDIKPKLTLAKTTGVKTVSTTANTVGLKWTKVKDASGYVIYRYDSAKKNWVKIGSTTKNSFNATKLKSSKTYKFAVKAYKKLGSKYVKGGQSATVTAMTTPAKPTVKTYSAAKKATLVWKKSARADGYLVYYKTSKTGSYKLLKTTKLNYFKKSGLTSGKTYYFAVRAYRKFNGKKYNSEAVYKTVTVK